MRQTEGVGDKFWLKASFLAGSSRFGRGISGDMDPRLRGEGGFVWRRFPPTVVIPDAIASGNPCVRCTPGGKLRDGSSDALRLSRMTIVSVGALSSRFVIPDAQRQGIHISQRALL